MVLSLEFEAVYTGRAYDDPALAQKLASPEGQAKIVEALKMLKGRTDFKGTSQYGNMGQGDVKFSDETSIIIKNRLERQTHHQVLSQPTIRSLLVLVDLLLH